MMQIITRQTQRSKNKHSPIPANNYSIRTEKSNYLQRFKKVCCSREPDAIFGLNVKKSISLEICGRTFIFKTKKYQQYIVTCEI